MKASLGLTGRNVAPLALALTTLVAAAAAAQSPRGRVVIAPNSPTRVAGIAPPPAPAHQSYGYGSTVQLGETAFGSVPAIVLGDGRVLVDFGNGYEQIGRPCPYEYGYGCQSYGGPIAPFTPINPRFAPAYNTPQYAPPAYGSPMYPAGGFNAGGGYNQPTFPPPGYGNNQPTGLPTSGYAANGQCPPHYVPTGGYPPCVDPVRVTSGGGLAPAGGEATANARPMPARGTGYNNTRSRAVGVYRR